MKRNPRAVVAAAAMLCATACIGPRTTPGAGSREILIDSSVVFPVGVDRTMQVFALEANAAIGTAVAGALAEQPPPLSGDLIQQIAKRREGRPPASAGDVEIFGPVFSSGGMMGTDDADTAAGTAFLRRVLPADATELEVTSGHKLASLEVRKNGTSSAIRDYAIYVHALRRIGGVRVVGEGSVAAVRVRRGEISGAVIKWNRAIPSGAVALQKVSKPVFQSVVAGLVGDQCTGSSAAMTISRVDLVYYDDRVTLTPRYSIEFRIDRTNGKPDFFTMIVPPERFLTAVPVVNPITTADRCMQSVSSMAQKTNVDRYVIAGDACGAVWEQNAHDFGVRITRNNQFVNRNHCLAEARFFGSKKSEFVDSADIALVEAHGSPGEIETNVGLSEVFTFGRPAGGLGGNSSRQSGLKLLVLHSCSVIASPDDDAAGWHAPWWVVFDGLHTVVGFRSATKINDGVSPAYAEDLAAGSRLVSSWLMRVEAAYPPGSVNPGLGATVTPCKEDNDDVAGLAQLATPDCLVIWWHRTGTPP